MQGFKLWVSFGTDKNISCWDEHKYSVSTIKG